MEFSSGSIRSIVEMLKFVVRGAGPMRPAAAALQEALLFSDTFLVVFVGFVKAYVGFIRRYVETGAEICPGIMTIITSERLPNLGLRLWKRSN